MFELLYDLANQMNCNLFNEGDKKSFPINVTVEDGNYHVYAAIPGVNKEDIKIDFENSLLTIKTECKKEENKNDRFVKLQAPSKYIHKPKANH